MPGSCASLIRLIRRRVVLGLIFALSLTYCAFSLFRDEKRDSLSLSSNLDDMNPMMLNDNNEDLMPDDNMLPEELRVPSKPLLWQMEIPDRADNTGNMDMIKYGYNNLNKNNVSTQPCRNSIQGKGLIVDERGIVCSRHKVLSNGCCTMEQKQASKNEETSSIAKRERYSCETCNSRGCCTIYEYCVSCCLDPDKQILQIKGRKSGSARMQKDGGRLRIRNPDRFQICLAVCRTSSLSVEHENTYKDPLAKHCYVPQPLNSQRQRRNINSLKNNGDSPAVVITSSSVVMLLTHLSLPEYYTLYCPLNESYVDPFPSILTLFISKLY
ncbi:SREBP regulating gene protein [Camponotus japonicus]